MQKELAWVLNSAPALEPTMARDLELPTAVVMAPLSVVSSGLDLGRPSDSHSGAVKAAATALKLATGTGLRLGMKSG